MDICDCIELGPSDYSRDLNIALVRLIEGLEEYGFSLSCHRRYFRKDAIVITLDLSRNKHDLDEQGISEEVLKTEFILLDAGIEDAPKKSSEVRWISHLKDGELFWAVMDLLFDAKKKRKCLEPRIYLIKNCGHLHTHKIAAISDAADILEALRCFEIEELDFLEKQKKVHRRNLETLREAE